MYLELFTAPVPSTAVNAALLYTLDGYVLKLPVVPKPVTDDTICSCSASELYTLAIECNLAAGSKTPILSAVNVPIPKFLHGET